MAHARLVRGLPGARGVGAARRGLARPPAPRRGPPAAAVGRVVLDPRAVELEAAGTLEGEIAAARRGHEGFGYDPIFVPLGESLTVAELGDAWKAEHSHRAQAARMLGQLLAER